MKRLICTLLTAMVLLGGVAAAEQVILEWEGDCPHLLCDFGVIVTEHQEYLADVEDTAGYSSAVCAYCQELYLLCPEGAAITVQEGATADCAHVFCKKGVKLSEGWEPTFNSSMELKGETIQYFSTTHEYRVYYACECITCGEKMHYYEGLQVNGMGITHHEYEAFGTGINIHLHETN